MLPENLESLRNRRGQLISTMITVAGLMTAIKIGTVSSLPVSIAQLFILFLVFALVYYVVFIALDINRVPEKKKKYGWLFFSLITLPTSVIFAGFLSYFLGITEIELGSAQSALPITLAYYIILGALFTIALSVE